jgi:hypothetical protein
MFFFSWHVVPRKYTDETNYCIFVFELSTTWSGHSYPSLRIYLLLSSQILCILFSSFCLRVCMCFIWLCTEFCSLQANIINVGKNNKREWEWPSFGIHKSSLLSAHNAPKWKVRGRGGGGDEMKLCHFSTASLVCKEGIANFYFFIAFREFACFVARVHSMLKKITIKGCSRLRSVLHCYCAGLYIKLYLWKYRQRGHYTLQQSVYPAWRLSFSHLECLSQRNLKVFKWITQLDAAISRVCCLLFKYGSTYFGHPHAHHQELNNWSCSLWFTVGTCW